MSQETFEDTKGVTGSQKWKKNRQYNGQKYKIRTNQYVSCLIEKLNNESTIGIRTVIVDGFI